MIKKIMLVLSLILSPIYAFDKLTDITINNTNADSNIRVDGNYINIKVKCDKHVCGDGIDSVNRSKLIAIARLKSVKSWVRDFSNGSAIKYLKTVKISDTERIITFIICNSSNSKMYDNTFGIEILYKDK